ncbi:hypothetical protein BH23GEM9_BH23GEM9_37180 [soil metagenome]
MTASVGPVIVAVDFSETAAVALLEARRLAGLLGTRMQVIHVVDGGDQAHWEVAGAAESAEWLVAMGCGDELIVRFGNPWVELARYAADVAPTLLVVGSHGMSGYQPLTIGSTASRVSLHARCPVVVVSPRVGSPAFDGSMQDRKHNVASRADAVAVARSRSGDL